MAEQFVPEIHGTLRKFRLSVPEEIDRATGIRVLGRKIKSVVFSTDVCIIRNTNADAVIAVYPFTPQPIITQAIMSVSESPVFVGVGGGLTQGARVIELGTHAEHQGALGVVVNAPTKNEVIRELSQTIDIPVIVTVVSENCDISERLEAGAQILNVSGGVNTAKIVRKIRSEFPQVPILATGGPTGESIIETIEAGANAISWTPPTNGDIFKDIMQAYRRGEGHPEF
ncbi:MAG: hydrolase [Acutalibacteraceae bacterium]